MCEYVSLRSVRQFWQCMNKKEINIDRSPSYHKLKTMARRHLDQMIRTQNFMVRNQRIETGVLVKTRKGEKCQREKENG